MAGDSELAKVDDQQIGAASPQHFNWVGLNPSQIKGISMAMALSDMFPDVRKDSAKAFVKIMAGQEMGIAPFQAMSDISIIEGKAAAGGNIHASKVKSSGRYDYRVKKWDNTECSIEFFERVDGKRESIGVASFTVEDARNAGMFDPLCPDAPAKHNIRKIEKKSKYGDGKYVVEGCLCKDNWKKYARNMLFNRAMTSGVRTYCPDALNGVNAYTPEELGAVVDGEGHVVDYQPERVQPAPAASTKPSRADQAQEAEVIDGPTVIQQIGEELEAKGFHDADERKAIALSAAGVDSAGKASPDQWVKVLENIRSMSAEALTSLIPDTEDSEPEQQEPPVVNVKVDEPAPAQNDRPLNDVQKKILHRRAKDASGRETEEGIADWFEDNFDMQLSDVRQSHYDDTIKELNDQIAAAKREEAELNNPKQETKAP